MFHEKRDLCAAPPWQGGGGLERACQILRGSIIAAASEDHKIGALAMGLRKAKSTP
jgi:hypothetical protein